MSVRLQILVLLACRCRSRLLPVVDFQVRVFALLRRASIRTNGIFRLFHIQRRVWPSFWIVRYCRRMPRMNIRIYSCCRLL